MTHQRPRLLPLRAWGYAFRRAWAEFWAKQCFDEAGNLTHFAVLSIFPGLLALLTTLSLFGQGNETAQWLVTLLTQIAPPTVVELLRDPITHLTNIPNAAWILVLAISIGLWSASAYVAAFGRVMNRIFGVLEGRPLWMIIPYNLLLTLLILLVGMLVMLALIVSGEVVATFADLIGQARYAFGTWLRVRWLVVITGAIVVVSGLYNATPNVRRRLRPFSLGSVFALAIIGVALAGFNWWVTSFVSFNATYGVIGSFIVFILGMWIMNLALVFGAVLDAELQRARMLTNGQAAELELGLELRSDRTIERRRRAYGRVIAAGRRLRIRAAREQANAGDADRTDGPADS